MERATESRRTLPSAAASDVVESSGAAGDDEEAGAAGAKTTLEDLFTPETRPERPAKRRGSRIGCLIALAIVLALLGGVAAGGLWVWNTYGERISAAMGWDGPHDYEEGLAQGEALVTVSTGDTGESISEKLHGCCWRAATIRRSTPACSSCSSR
jgi:UPF0755 protein